MVAQGIARVEVGVEDISVLISTGLKGIHAFLGETERGELGTSVLIGSWSEYRKHFGGFLSTSNFPVLCKRALDAGTKLRIARAASYTDPTDDATATGAVATILVDTDARVDATSRGTWGNSIKFEVKAPTSLTVGKQDIHIYVDGAAEGDNRDYEIIYDVNTILTATDVAAINAGSILADFSDGWVAKDLSTVLPLANVITLVNGADVVAPAPIDLIGDSSAVTGIHSFDDATDFTRISIPSFAISAVDSALVNYAFTRKDCRAILRTPTGISGSTAVEYRNKTGAYAGDGEPINSWYGSMIFGGLKVLHPQTGAKIVTPALADVAARYTNKDNTAYEWFSAAGPKRGLLSNAGTIEYNLGTAARALEAENVDTQGINPVINDIDYGLAYWGVATLQRTDTLLKHENVADLLIFLVRAIKPLAKSSLFDPNDIKTWKEIYRKVNPLLRQVKTLRGIHDYIYQGDQDVDKVTDAEVNSTEDIDKGKYCFNLFIQPTVALKYIGIRIAVTNSGTSFEEITEDN